MNDKNATSMVRTEYKENKANDKYGQEDSGQ